MSVPIPEWEVNDGPIEEGYRDRSIHMSQPRTYRGFDHEPPHTPYGTQYVPPPPPPPRKRRVWLWVLIIVIIGLIAIGIAAAAGGGNTSSTPNDQFTAGAKKPGPSAKKWVPLATLKGSADKSSDTITTTGGRIRLTYTFTSTNDIVAGAIYFLKEGTDIQKSGAVPDIMITQAGKDSTILRKGKGQYFLQVIIAGANYTITVEEEK